MFFKQPPEVGKLTHIIISAHGRAGANTGADIWKGGGLRQRQKTSGPFLKRPWSFKKRPWSFSERTRTSGPEKKGPATYVSGESRARPEASHKIPTTEFWRTAATATTQPPETAMDRAFQGVVAPHFLGGKKGCCHHFWHFFTPKRPLEKENTSGKGEGNEPKKTGMLKDKTPATDGREAGCSPPEPWFHTDKHTVTARWN